MSGPHQGLASGPEDIRFPSCHWYSEGAAWLLCLQPSGSHTWLLLDSSQPSQRTSHARFSQSTSGDRMLTYRNSAPQSFRPDHSWPSRLVLWAQRWQCLYRHPGSCSTLELRATIRLEHQGRARRTDAVQPIISLVLCSAILFLKKIHPHPPPHTPYSSKGWFISIFKFPNSKNSARWPRDTI